MNPAEFRIWSRRYGFGSLQDAVSALGLPETQFSRFEAGDRTIGGRLELACLAYEYCVKHHRAEQEIFGYYTSLQQRIRRFLEMEPQPHDKDLAAALVLGLAAIARLKSGEWGQEEFLAQAYELLAQSPKWNGLARRLGLISVKPSGRKDLGQIKKKSRGRTVGA